MSKGTAVPEGERKMRVGTILASLVLLSAVAWSAADEKKARPAAEKSPGLEKFKQLAGEWVGKETGGGQGGGQEVRAIYKVTYQGEDRRRQNRLQVRQRLQLEIGKRDAHARRDVHLRGPRHPQGGMDALRRRQTGRNGRL